MSGVLRRKGQLIGRADFQPGNAIQRGLPADLYSSISIPIGVAVGALDGECLSDGGRALDEEGGVTVIDVGDVEGIGVDGFVEALGIGVVDGCGDASSF